MILRAKSSISFYVLIICCDYFTAELCSIASKLSLDTDINDITGIGNDWNLVLSG